MATMCQNDLFERGWTSALIRDFLGRPDARRVNPWHVHGAKVKVFNLHRVLAAEQSHEFLRRRARLDALRKRQYA